MIGQHERRFLLPGDSAWHTNQTDEGVAETRIEDRPQPAWTVKCSNPKCGLELTVPAELLGKKSTCPHCGTMIYTGDNGVSADIAAPMPDRSIALHRPAPSTTVQGQHAAPLQRINTLPVVRTGCIGRGNAGKTAIFRALSDGPVGDFLPSGLNVDAGDPREVARMIRESEETQRLLHLAGLPPTLVASRIRYYLYEGAEQRAIYQLDEVIGQVLTHTLPDSATEQQARYDEYLANLVNTQVLWTVVPCPPTKPGAARVPALRQ